MVLDYNIDGYRLLTDNTADIAIDTLFLLTEQNRVYFDKFG